MILITISRQEPAIYKKLPLLYEREIFRLLTLVCFLADEPQPRLVNGSVLSLLFRFSLFIPGFPTVLLIFFISGFSFFLGHFLSLGLFFSKCNPFSFFFHGGFSFVFFHALKNATHVINNKERQQTFFFPFCFYL